MMRIHNRWLALLGAIGVSLAVAGAALADEGKESSYIHGALRKLGRGAVNIVTAPLEMLRTPELVVRKEGYLAGMSVGLFHGAWHTVQRAGGGVIDLATFPLEIPNDFAPLVEPEFIFAHGEWAQ
jgi:putative exosortase-associated protein (TIGR04073 family)